MATVSRLSIAPVKGLALVHPEEVVLEREGVVENRRFYLIDEEGERFALLRWGPLVQVGAEYDDGAGRLTLRFPDGGVTEGEVELGEAIVTDFYGRPVPGRVVRGPWAEALSAFAERPLRLVRSDEPGAAVDRRRGAVSVVSDASLDELARRSGRDEVDARRFRMLIGVDGLAPHEEDTWLGRRVRIGEALVDLVGRVARCAITTQSPDTGERDFDTLRAIKEYRGVRDKGIDFGIFGEVVEPGRVRVGDAAAPVELALSHADNK